MGEALQPSGQHANRTTGVMLVSFVVLVLILGGINLRNELTQSVLPTEAEVTNSAASDEEHQLATLRGQDTDSDGLTDYDELYLHDTSPYIQDSDSDGTSDTAELNAGSNPNCPSGDTCGVGATNPITDDGTDDTATAIGSVSTEELRQALINAGAPEHLVNSVSDEELIQLYQDTIGVTGEDVDEDGGTATNAAIDTNASTVTDLDTAAEGGLTTEELRALSPDEIRDFLQLGGLDEATLNEIDDDTLKAIFEEALSEEGI